MRRHGQLAFGAVVLGLVLGSTACVDERIVYQDRDLVGELPAGHEGFVGLSEEESNLTVCGNCHVGFQGEWEQTAHAEAWETLQGSGHAQALCENCHTVNQLGNVATADGGWATTDDERYHNVQCESCHGPGLAHIQNPGDTNIPLAPLAVGLDMETGCGECHQGSHHPFVEDWAQSAHGSVPHQASPGSREACQGCHTGEGALAMFGVKADYLEKETVLPSLSEQLPITCAVCHDPHDATNPGQLRFTVATTNIDEHLCAQCHNRRTQPATGSSHGLEPHAPEAALLVGDAGAFFEDMSFEAGEIYGSHGPGGNPKLCATCHVSSFQVTDAITGDFKVTATGHLFNAIPCVDAEGIPQPRETTCAVTAEARSFQGCATGGCHASENAAASALRSAALNLQQRADELHELLLQVDANLLGAGGAINPADSVLTVAEMAFYNMELAEFRGAVDNIAGPDSDIHTWGSAAHNPFLVNSLLVASIQRVKDKYGVTAASRASDFQFTVPARLQNR